MQLKSRQYFIQSNHGFTMIELLVAMVVALLALGAIYSTFLNQQKSYVVQQETATMHQNVRSECKSCIVLHGKRNSDGRM